MIENRAHVDALVFDYVNEHPACNAIELIAALAHKDKFNTDAKDLMESLATMVTDQKILELEYALSSSSYRIRSLFFPAGTVFDYVSMNKRT